MGNVLTSLSRVPVRDAPKSITISKGVPGAEQIPALTVSVVPTAVASQLLPRQHSVLIEPLDPTPGNADWTKCFAPGLLRQAQAAVRGDAKADSYAGQLGKYLRDCNAEAMSLYLPDGTSLNSPEFDTKLELYGFRTILAKKSAGYQGHPHLLKQLGNDVTAINSVVHDPSTGLQALRDQQTDTLAKVDEILKLLQKGNNKP
eukprot:TRINITY_DN487_c0_g1_i1.p1 TRINITY_DN487_c0_g1~~TRINITY_DN487_c0_g1_i1.p1  ORF type:complete len:202 (+),score=6.68 TRINITY_DN487_c0_g1_i1:27-632(+)